MKKKKFQDLVDPVKLISTAELQNKKPTHAKVERTDLVVIKFDEEISVLYGRCLHRGALLSDGYIDGHNLICGLHNWDYRIDSGVSEYNNSECLKKFSEVVHESAVYVDRAEIISYEEIHPPAFDEQQYLGDYVDTHPEPPEPYTREIQEFARNGLKNFGHHGPTAAMGVERDLLPKWDSIQMLPAQMAKKPLLDDTEVSTKVVIGPEARKPLELEIPLFVSDMSFGALSREAKIALSKGAEMAGTGICSGEGGMLPDEQANNSRYFYELASAQFGFELEKAKKAQAFHFKGGQGAKVGTGGHLPGNKVSKEIASVRGLNEGETAISPATFTTMSSIDDFKELASAVREVSGGIPIGFKLAASHIEDDIDFALSVGADYIILDGRGGGTGAAPLILRNNICVPTIPALARARYHLNKSGAQGVSLVITGGLRTPGDFAKALALGADAIALSNVPLQAIGCQGMRACHTNNCPVGIATQKEHLRARLDIEQSATQLYNYFTAATDLIKVLARACGYNDINEFKHSDLSTFDPDMHRLSGVKYAGVNY